MLRHVLEFGLTHRAEHQAFAAAEPLAWQGGRAAKPEVSGLTQHWPGNAVVPCRLTNVTAAAAMRSCLPFPGGVASGQKLDLGPRYAIYWPGFGSLVWFMIVAAGRPKARRPDRMKCSGQFAPSEPISAASFCEVLP